MYVVMRDVLYVYIFRFFSFFSSVGLVKFLGRLPKVDLIILEGGNVRPYVRPSTKSFFDFNEIW